jgi:uncharacterized membrane protein (TIGR02234 family)
MRRFDPTTKSGVVLLALVGAGLLLVSGSRTWVSGTVDDAVLGASRITGSGTEVASGVVALALAALAAAIASTTSGRVVRRATLALLMLAALGELAFIGRVLLDPSGVLGSVAAASTGRTGTIETRASATAWPWIALGAAVLLVACAVGGWLGSARWQGLGARYETPGGDRAGARGQRVASDWDRLDAGEDPTQTGTGTTPATDVAAPTNGTAPTDTAAPTDRAYSTDTSDQTVRDDRRGT